MRAAEARAPRAIVLGLGLAASVAAIACAGAPLEADGDGGGDASASGAEAGRSDGGVFDGGTIVAMYGAPACDVAIIAPTGSDGAPAGGALLGATMILVARRRKQNREPR